MKMQEAMDIIEQKGNGFMVSFDKLEGAFLSGGHFPDKHDGEQMIPSESEAWELARKFATAAEPLGYFNIYVVDHNFHPVAGYEQKQILKR